MGWQPILQSQDEEGVGILEDEPSPSPKQQPKQSVPVDKNCGSIDLGFFFF